MIALRGEIGCVAKVPSRLVGANLTRGVALIALKQDEVVPDYILQALQSDPVKVELAQQVNGSALQEIPIGGLRKVKIPMPPLAEQRKIATILSAWDEAIATTERLVAALRERKRELMQRLLTGRVRFPKFKSVAWKAQTFGTFLREGRIPGSNGAVAKKLSIKLYGKGVQAKADGQPGSEDTRYYRRKAGQFIYSKLDFLNGAFGIVPAELDGYESTLDLPAFDISTEVNSFFLLAYVTRESFYKSQLGKARGGRKARRVPPDEFLAIEILLPSREEQDRIAEVLAACDAEIAAQAQQLALLHRQKRGLMQRLLTGQVRVQIDEQPASVTD